MKFLIILVLSFPVLSGPNQSPNRFWNAASYQFGGLFSYKQWGPFCWTLLNLIWNRKPELAKSFYYNPLDFESFRVDRDSVRFQDQEFTIIPNSGTRNDCFFLALQQASIALTRELAVEIFIDRLQNPEDKLIIAQELAQDWIDGHFIPQTAVTLNQELDLAELAETNLVLLREYIESFIGGPNMFVLTPGRRGLVDILGRAMHIQIRVLIPDPNNQTNMILIHETEPISDPLTNTVHLLFSENHFELLRTQQNRTFEPIPMRTYGHVIECDLGDGKLFYLLRLHLSQPAVVLGCLSGVFEYRKHASGLRTFIIQSKVPHFSSGHDFFQIFEFILELVSLPHLRLAFIQILSEMLGIENSVDTTTDLKTLISRASLDMKKKRRLKAHTTLSGVTNEECIALIRAIHSLFILHNYFNIYFNQLVFLNSRYMEYRQSFLEPVELQVIQEQLTQIRTFILEPVQSLGEAFSGFISGSLNLVPFMKQINSIEHDKNIPDYFRVLAFLDARPRGPLDPADLSGLIKLLRHTTVSAQIIDLLETYQISWSKTIKSATQTAQSSPKPSASVAASCLPPEPAKHPTQKVKTRREARPTFFDNVDEFSKTVRNQIQSTCAYHINGRAAKAMENLTQRRSITEADARALLEQIGLDVTTGRSAGSRRGVTYANSKERAGGFEVGHGGYLDGYVKNPEQLLRALCVAAQYDERLAALLEQYGVDWKSYFPHRSER